MNRLVIAGLAAMVMCGDLAAGSIYKCTDAAGNVSFSQTACPAKESGDQIGYSAPSRRSSSAKAKQKQRIAEPEVQYQPQAQPDYRMPTPMEQVRQLELEKEKKAIKHRQWELDKERRLDKLDAERADAPTRRKEVKIDRAKCEYYKARARRYEYKDDENHAFYNMRAAETCR